MGKITGFIESQRLKETYEPISDRLHHYREFVISPPDEMIATQASRCMDCGIPFCQTGCPVNNIIPDWNDLVYRNNWREAIDVLHSTNNFPEFTGRVCPAPCETACTLYINDDAVAIKSIERTIVDYAFQSGWVEPRPNSHKTRRRVAIIGSGPAGLACAQQLARAGHDVTVYEKNESPGGLLRFGIPDFKLEKSLIDRRLQQLEAEGVIFSCNTPIDATAIEAINSEYDAIALCCGSEYPRDLPIPGRQLDGVHFAMSFLPQQNRRVANLPIHANPITATGKNVIVIGGGDTGSDCVGTSNRQQAASVTQLELMPTPPDTENKELTWPHWPLKMRSSTSHIEGCERQWSVQTKAFSGHQKVEKIVLSKLEWNKQGQMQEVPQSEFELPADLVLLAMGYVHPTHEGLLDSLKVKYDHRGNVAADDLSYQTSVKKVFTAGDTRRGQSLVVWAIREGRQCAHSIDQYLMGKTSLPR